MSDQSFNNFAMSAKTALYFINIVEPCYSNHASWTRGGWVLVFKNVKDESINPCVSELLTAIVRWL